MNAINERMGTQLQTFERLESLEELTFLYLLIKEHYYEKHLLQLGCCVS